MMDEVLLNNLLSLQKELQSTSSRLEKQSIMVKHLDNKDLNDLVLLIYNPYKKFNVSSKRIKNFNKDLKNYNVKSYCIMDLLEDLTNRSISGENAVVEILNYINDYKNFEQLILDIIDKDLKVHISIKGLLNTFNNNATKKLNFSVALAQSFNDKTKQLINKDWFISRKLDGVRCICIIKDGNVSYFSRQGNVFLTLGKITQEIKKIGLDNIVLDGEIAIIKNNIEDFQGIMKEIRKKNHTIDNLHYFVFDTLTLSEFETGVSKRTFKERMTDRPNIQSQNITYLEQYPYSVEEFNMMENKVVVNGWEGLILRKDAKYKGKRSTDILKVKNFKDDEFRVETINTGIVEQYNQTNNLYEKVNGMTAVVIKYKGNNVAVGSGFSAKERIEYMNTPDLIIGKIIKVRYFEETSNQENDNLSLRFPTFKGIIGIKRDT